MIVETTSTNEIPTGSSFPDQAQQQSNPSMMPMLAGILLIIAGLLGLLTWAAALAVDTSMIQSFLPANSPITADQLRSFLMVCGIIGSILSIVALAGGIVALRRRGWGLAIVGSILGLFTVGPYLLASILALVGLILLVISRKEFQ
jgi:hypothetical protein